MGALHAGHRSLIERAASECDVVAVTVFVNPLQFDDAADLAAYPRDLDTDVPWPAAAGASVVFAPPVHEMYGAHPEAVASTVACRRRERGARGGVATGPLRRGGHRGGQALRPVGAVPGLLRREGLPAAGRGPAHGCGPVHPGDDRGVPDGARGRRAGPVESQRPALAPTSAAPRWPCTGPSPRGGPVSSAASATRCG